eukprot:TRINITY_DN8533_c0_g1_i1.p1 TRINITY_DN8533_c0_g1~~TRINITY_DN8533_c0_g1_i1.p1  ORF type:complete len:504 (+),score=154.40 TRINITY_DN8533_c0_g1_i1:41-1513(+)
MANGGRLESTKQSLLSNLEVLASNSDGNLVEDASIKISNLLESPDAIKLILSQEVFPFLKKGLYHNDEQVVRLTLSQIAKCAENSSALSHLDDAELFLCLISLLQSDSLSLSEKTASVFYKMCKSNEGSKMFFHNTVISNIKKIINNPKEFNETVRFRFLSLVFDIASINSSNFSKCEELGFFDDIVNELDTSDVLQLLTVLEILEKISSSKDGVNYLEKKGTLNKLSQTLKQLIQSGDPLGTYVVPRLLIFFGKIASLGEKELNMVEGYQISELIKNRMNDGNRDIQEAAITSLGFLGSTFEGLNRLKELNLLNDFASVISTELPLRVASFHSLGFMLDNLSKNESNREETERILSEFLLKLPHRTRAGDTCTILEVIMPILTQQPFPDLRTASFQTLKGISQFSFGVENLFNYPGFFEFILNRNSEATKEGKELKYEVVQRLVKSIEKYPSLTNVVEKSKFYELQRYTRQGPFHVEASSAVAVESRSS